MDAPAVALSAVLGLLVGWFVVVPVVERIPEPSPLARRAQVVVAVVNGALWAADANKFPRWWIVVPYFVIFSTLLAVSVVDLRLYRIPDRILFPALGLTVVMMIVSTIVVQHGRGSVTEVLKHAAVGMVTYFAILFVFHIVSPRGMGFGDVKLALLMGLGLGWLGATVFNAAYLVLIALFLGCVLGIVFGLSMRLIKGRGGAFPFGPALALATVYVILTFEKYITTI
jgi:prepilin signal peptidase PulO-like enzyme (type II secretory pathway)